MTLTEAQLKEIEDFAYKYISRKDISLVIGLPDPSVLDDEEDPAGIAFKKGRIRRKAQFNYNIIQLSDQLSSPAQNIELKLAEATHLNDKKR